MEKIEIQPKMSNFTLNCMCFEISLSIKNNTYRARCGTLGKINAVKSLRPEASSKISYDNAVHKLIPKIEAALEGTNKKLGKIFNNEEGKLMFSVDDIFYENTKENPLTVQNQLSGHAETLDTMVTLFNKILINISSITQKQVSTPYNMRNDNNIALLQQTSQIIQSRDFDKALLEPTEEKYMSLKDVITEWLQYLNERTKKSYEDDEYFSPTTLQSYNRYIWGFIFPYLEKNPQFDNIYNFTEKNVDEIFAMTNSKETQRIMLVSLRLAFEYAKSKSYIEQNPIANKKQKKSNKKKKVRSENDVDYAFIEEEERALWINCMIKDINCVDTEKTDAALAFLFTLLHGMRPEETCGVKWSHLNFAENDFYVQNAYKTDPIFDETTMKRTGWVNQDGPLKTPESYRHLPIDILVKGLLLEHKKQQKAEFKDKGKKWTENEYVFLNSSRTPFTPKVLSRNFSKFVKRNNLTYMVLYSLRHSFATHCRNLGMPPEILARLMGHTEYETTQKYYIHISAKQKREELQKIQQKDIQIYLGEENKDYTHLQNKINNNKITELQEIQALDMKDYNEIDDKTLNVLKNFISNLQQQIA